MKFRVDINRRPGLSDPEGVTTARALRDLGYDVSNAAFGRSIEIDVNATDTADATAQVNEMCERLLANPVIEDYVVSIVDPATHSS